MSTRASQGRSSRAASPPGSKHSEVLADKYGSSYTRPLYENGRLRGFLFFDAVEKGFFTPAVVPKTSVTAQKKTQITAAPIRAPISGRISKRWIGPR